MRYVKTSEIREGDVVLCHGMKCLVETPLSNYGHGRPDTLSTRALVLNRDEVPFGLVPRSFTLDRDGVHRWTIQGNDLATWAILDDTEAAA